MQFGTLCFLQSFLAWSTMLGLFHWVIKMTNEAMLQFIKDIQTAHSVDWQLLTEFQHELEQDILKEAVKESGRQKPQQLAVKLLQRAAREQFKMAWMEGDTQYFMDDVAGFALRKHLVLNMQTYPPFNLSDAIGRARSRCYLELKLPSLGILLAYIKTNKTYTGKKFISWKFGAEKFGGEKPIVDAQRLYDVLVILPDAEAKYCDNLHSIYFYSSDGEAILAPIHPGEKKQVYRYYLTQRQPAPGTFPKLQSYLDLEAYLQKTFIEEIHHSAWGWVEYGEQLCKQLIDDYELTPAPEKMEDR